MDKEGTSETSMLNLLDVPVEVIEGHLLAYLSWNDLLRFQRVCKATQAVTRLYMLVHPERAPEIEISDENPDRGLEAFLKMKIPTTRIFLNVSGDEFYKDKLIDQFLKNYATIIRHFRVTQLSLYCSGKELDFMDALENVQSFEAGCYGIFKDLSAPAAELERTYKEKLTRAGQDPRFVNHYVPNAITKSKSVRIGQQKGVPIRNIISHTAYYMRTIKTLEYISLPFNSNICRPSAFPASAGDPHPSQAMELAFQVINLNIASNYPENPNLRMVDFASYHDIDDDEDDLDVQMQLRASAIFLQLCANCVKYNVKLLNVGPFWFYQRRNLPKYTSPELGWPVVSLLNLHSCILPLDMPNLETIKLRETSNCDVGPSWRQEGRPGWPALKTLDITIDNKGGLIAPWGERRFVVLKTKNLFSFFFQDILRTTLTELCLNFTKEKESVSIPNTEQIASACPNLEKLTIVNWPGTNKALTVLWSGLPCLKEISLEYCKELGNVAFVGTDVKNPVFFNLKELKKLSLKGVDKMPKITDTLFSLVISHTKLSHFTLTSDQPIKSVTPSGVLGLLGGVFGESIEKFSFKDWSLAGVSPEEFKNMETKFRSYNML